MVVRIAGNTTTLGDFQPKKPQERALQGLDSSLPAV